MCVQMPLGRNNSLQSLTPGHIIRSADDAMQHMLFLWSGLSDHSKIHAGGGLFAERMGKARVSW